MHLNRRSTITAIVCVVGLAFVAIIISHEISELSRNTPSQNRGVNETLNETSNSCQVCIDRYSETEKDYPIFSVANIWRLVCQTASLKAVYQLLLVFCKSSNSYILTTIYDFYIVSVISTATILSIVLLRILGPTLDRYSPILAIYSFLTWRPILIAILTTVSYKIYTASPDAFSALALPSWLLAFLILATFKFLDRKSVV